MRQMICPICPPAPCTRIFSLAKRSIRDAVNVVVCTTLAYKSEPAGYPVPPPELVERVAKAAKTQYRYVAAMNSQNLSQQVDGAYNVELDEKDGWLRVEGSVVCSKDTKPEARVTFRLTTDDGTVIFERVGQKGNDAPQLVAVNIPKSAKSLKFTFTRDADSPAVPTLGVWKDIRLVK